MLLLFVSDSSLAANVADTYLAKVRVRLCSQYAGGGTALDLAYRIGSDPTAIPLEIVSQSINRGANEGTFQFRLPRTLGRTPMHVEARCRNAQGYGPPSNPISVSNCNFLEREDNDQDGVPDNIEDYNCDNHYNFGDLSDRNNPDTDGDGVMDLVEFMQGGNPVHPGISPRPVIFSGAPFDPDGNGDSNAVVWRPSSGVWYIRDFIWPDYHIAFQFGLPGDTPFIYQPQGYTSNVGVIRNWYNYMLWFFNGPGFAYNNGYRTNLLLFGLHGDTIIAGPWETPGVSNPAVARLYQDVWYYFIYTRDGGMRVAVWGRGGDVPKVQDYDGDGVFDIAVYRPSTQQTYVIRSIDGTAAVYNFGSAGGDNTVRGDVTGDGVDDITTWDPATGMYTTLMSDGGFNTEMAKTALAPFKHTLQLGLYYIHVPMNWNRQNGKILYTVVDHQWGLRYVRPGNDPNAPPTALQWGLVGDSQG